MKFFLTLMLVAALSLGVAQRITTQYAPVKSTVYKWISPGSEANGDTVHEILAGSTTALQELRVAAHAMAPGSTNRFLSAAEEQLFIVKAGRVDLMLEGKHHTLRRGSVVVVMPGDALEIKNGGREPAQFYAFTYTARNKPGWDVQASYVVDWEALEMKSHDKGGRRDFFDRPTAMYERFEMHVTTLNEGLQSHPAHSHNAEEFILVFQGDVEEEIGEKNVRASEGDLIFLDSMVPHSITNVGKGPAMYFAFQWE